MLFIKSFYRKITSIIIKVTSQFKLTASNKLIYTFLTTIELTELPMPSYIVKNGHLQPRQKDTNIPTYRIIPYKSITTPAHNDYINSTIEQLQSQLSRMKQDYYNLINSLWKILSQIDSTPYDPQIMFFNLQKEQIYNQISLIRNLNLTEQQQSLRLSAIIKVDENSITSPRQQMLFQENNLLTLNQTSPQRSFIKEIKQDSLYQIQEEEENHSNNSRVDEQIQNNNINVDQNETLPRFLPLIERKQSSSLSPQHNCNQHNNNSNNSNNINNHNNISRHSPHHILNLTGQKKQGRRTSFLLKQRISMALHQQQQLRQILQEQLQKLTQQLDQKNQYLSWTVQELKIRNQIIQKLKFTILLRDQALQMQQQQQFYNNNNNNQKNVKLSINNNTTNDHILQQKDKQIGLLINSLIQRTQQTYQDFQYLTKSIQQHQYQQQQLLNQNEQQLLQQRYDNYNDDKTIDIEELQKSVRMMNDSVNHNQKLNASGINNSNNVSQLQFNNNQISYHVAFSPSIISPIVQSHSRISSQEQSRKSIGKSQTPQQSVLQPKKMNFDSNQTITYLTKQHFLQAQRKTNNNFIFSNVKMTQSVKLDHSINSQPNY